MLGHSLLNEQFNPFPTRTTVVFFGVCQVLIKQMGFRSFRTLELGRGRGISNLDKKSPNYKACALNLN